MDSRSDWAAGGGVMVELLSQLLPYVKAFAAVYIGLIVVVVLAWLCVFVRIMRRR
jgi:hypothetical protein